MTDLIKELLNNPENLVHRDTLTVSWPKAINALKNNGACFLPYLNYLGCVAVDHRDRKIPIDTYRDPVSEKYLQVMYRPRVDDELYENPSTVMSTVAQVFEKVCNPDGERLVENIQDMARVSMFAYRKNPQIGNRLKVFFENLLKACGLRDIDTGANFRQMIDHLYDSQHEYNATLSDIAAYHPLIQFENTQREAITTALRELQNELQIVVLAEFDGKVSTKKHGNESVQTLWGNFLEYIERAMHTKDELQGKPWPYFRKPDVQAEPDVVSTKWLKTNHTVRTWMAILHSEHRTQLENMVAGTNVRRDMKQFGQICFLENILPEDYLVLGAAIDREIQDGKRVTVLLQPEYQLKCLKRILDLPSISEPLAHCICNIITRMRQIDSLPKLEDEVPEFSSAGGFRHVNPPAEPFQEPFQEPLFQSVEEQFQEKRVQVAKSKQKEETKDKSSLPLIIGALLIFYMVTR